MSVQRGGARKRCCASRRGERMLGVVFVAHFAAIGMIKQMQGLSHEMLWISHAALLMSGAGLVIGSARLVMSALVLVFWPHVLWLTDAACGLMLGRYPLGMAWYLAGADAWTWIATSHHFYLLPVLLWVVARRGGVPHGTLGLTCGVLATLTTAGRLCFDASANVNYGYWVMPTVGHPVVRWMDALPGWAYLMFINIWMGVMMYWPTVRVMRRLVGGEPGLGNGRSGAMVGAC